MSRDEITQSRVTTPRRRPSRRGRAAVLLALSLVSPLCVRRGVWYDGPLWAASDDCASSLQMTQLLEELRAGAEARIAASDGIDALRAIEERMAREYGLERLPPVDASHGGAGVELSADQAGNGEARGTVVDRAGAYYLTGIEGAVKGYPAVAEWCFARAASLAPRRAVYLTNLAFLLNLRGDHERAMRLLTCASRLAPGLTSVEINLAHSHFLAGRYEDARERCRRARALDPENERYRWLHALAESRCGATLAIQDLQVRRALEALKRRRIPRPIPSGGAGAIDKARSLVAERDQAQRTDTKRSPMPRPQWPNPVRGAGELVVAGPSANPPRGAALWPMLSQLRAEHAALRQWMLPRAIEVMQRMDRARRVSKKAGWLEGYLLFSFFYERARSFVALLRGEGSQDLNTEQFLRDIEATLRNLFRGGPGEKDPRVSAQVISKVALGPLTFTQDTKGYWKLGFSGGILGADLKLKPTDLTDFGVKVSVGPQLKVGVGSHLSVKAKVAAYFEVASTTGIKVGLEAGVEAGNKGLSLGEGSSLGPQVGLGAKGDWSHTVPWVELEGFFSAPSGAGQARPAR